MRLAALLVLVGLLLTGACTQALPPERSSASLYRDLQRLVSIRATRGWQIDRIAIDDLEADALDSTCRAPHDAREHLLAWIDAEIERRGGPVETAWRQAGKDLDEVDDLLELTRVRLLLARALAAAPADCPFWLEPREPFTGLQIADDRFQLVLEGGGRLIVFRSEGATDFSAGGAGRLLLGRSFGPHLSLLLGFEMTGSAELPRDGEGVTFALDTALPLVVRWRFVNTYLEAGAGPLVHLTEDDRHLVPGLHTSVAFGFRALRQRFFVPGLALTLAYERTFPDETRRRLDLLKVGLRVSLDFDL